MTFETLRDVIYNRPFNPFVLKLADGRSLRVDHPEFVGFVGDKRTLMVSFEGSGHFELVDLILINSVEVGRGKGGVGKRKRAG